MLWIECFCPSSSILYVAIYKLRASLVVQIVKNLPPVQKNWVRSLSGEDSLERGMATHSSILAWTIPWTEELGRLQSVRSQRVGHDWATNTYTYKSDGIRRGGFGEMIRSWRWNSEISALMKETPESCLALSAMWAHSKKMAICNPEDSSHQNLTLSAPSCQTPASGTVRNTFVVYKPPSLWYPVTLNKTFSYRFI